MNTVDGRTLAVIVCALIDGPSERELVARRLSRILSTYQQKARPTLADRRLLAVLLEVLSALEKLASAESIPPKSTT